mgnify:CR=1 FL=1
MNYSTLVTNIKNFIEDDSTELSASSRGNDISKIT